MSNMQYQLHQNMIENVVQVALVGVGGSGGYMLDSLVKINAVLQEMGHKGLKITVFDDDVVSQSNIGRTKFSPVDVGHKKAEVLVSRYNQFYGLEMKAVPALFTVQDSCEFDLIVSCTDSAKFRQDMGQYSLDYRHENDIESDVLWLDMGNSDYSAQFILGHLFKDSEREGVFLPNVYDLYQDALDKAVETDDNKSSCGLLEAIEIQSLFVNPTVSSHSSALLYELFKKGVISVHGGEIDLETHTTKPMPINTQVWEFLGVKVDV